MCVVVISFTDDTAQYAQNMKLYIHHHSQRTGSPPSSIFFYIFLSTIANAMVIISILLMLGAFCYRYVSNEDDWLEGFFYAVTSATTIG